jgi:hypothetical protein
MAAFRTLSVRREESLGPGGYGTRSEEGEAQHWVARVQEIAAATEKLQLRTHSKVVAVAEQSMTEEVVLHHSLDPDLLSIAAHQTLTL